MNVRFSSRELLDLSVAWLALGVAFAIFLRRGVILRDPTALVPALGLTLTTAGVGFLLHELAHKLVAVHYGQVAEFRADYGMLFLTVAGALAGFLFAAPGAVHHRGHLTQREGGLIALAGPVTNLALVVVFFALWTLGGVLGTVANYGFLINALLAGFNMLPVSVLDGRTVLSWSTPVYLLVALPSFGLAAMALL
ncbi:MAG: metalloprotease [Haloarculaceae archaeon]